MILTVMVDDEERKFSLDGIVVMVIDKVISVSSTPDYIEYIREEGDGTNTRSRTSLPYKWLGVNYEGTTFEKKEQEKRLAGDS